jgi:DNA topoisomerase-1
VWSVRDVKETEAKRAPKPPFITSTLQQAASTRLGYSPSRTMQLAQKLYEAGHITYMRTDSTNLSSQALGQIKNVVEKNFGPSYYEPRVYGKKSKGAQEAHEAIRPSTVSKVNAGMTEEQKKLYRLIWSRTVASQMIDAKLLRTKVLVMINDGETPDFSVNGQRTLEEGA